MNNTTSIATATAEDREVYVLQIFVVTGATPLAEAAR
jgi:hypothetical protein